MGYDEIDIIEYFVKNPVKSFEEIEEFIEEVEEFLEKTAYAIETDLERSNIKDGSLQLENLTFYTPQKSGAKVKDLLCKAIIFGYNGNVPDVKGDLNGETKKHHGKDLRNIDNINSKEIELIKSIFEVINSERGEIISERMESTGGATYYRYSSEVFGDENGIAMRKLPKSFKHEAHVPTVLKPIIDFSLTSQELFKGHLMHELNHCYLNNESSHYEKSMHEDLAEAFNEIFAYYITYMVSGWKFENIESDLYDRPELIVWGIELLIEKTEELEIRGKESTGMDFARKIMLKMADNKYSLGVFLNFCLLKEDKKRLDRFQKVLAELRDSLKDFREFLDSLEKEEFEGRRTVKNSKSIKISALEEALKYSSLKAPSPDIFKQDFLRKVKREVVEDGDPYGDLEQINRIITKHLYEITEDLGEKKKLLEKERDKFDNQEIVDSIGEMEKEVFDYRKSLVEIIEEGRVDK